MKHWQPLLVFCAVVLLGGLLVPQVASAQFCCVMRGDVNETGTITSSDIIFLVNYVFKGAAAPACLDHGDVNLDASITSSDIIYLVNFVFKAGPDPAECPVFVPYVFIDEYGPGVTYEAFAGSFLSAVQIELDSVYAGTQGLVITIPSDGYSGGAFTDSAEIDLSPYNALTFWAKASMTATLNVAGLGNDNTGTSKYMAEVSNLPLTTDWQQFVLPFPLPEKLVAERGLLYFAEGPESGMGYQIWIDEIIVDSLPGLPAPTAALNSQTITVDSGAVVNVGNHLVTFSGVGPGGADVVYSTMPGYFTFVSSDPSIVSVSPEGVITAEGPGTATLTAELGTVAATGSITVNVNPAEPVPTEPAPTPTRNPDSVISLYSDAYTDVSVDTWSTVWDNADVEDVLIGTDNAKKYTNLVFAGIEFTSTMVDASSMTHLRFDYWSPDATDGGQVFKVKLVDFGADGAFGGGDDVEHEISLDATSTPALASGTWVSYDVPLSDFAGLTTTGHLAQLIISGDPNTVFLDNIYFRK